MTLVNLRRSTVGGAVLALGLLLSTAGGAARAETAPEAGSGWWAEVKQGFGCDLRTLSSGTSLKPADSSQNPGNAFLELPRYAGRLELRADLLLDYRRLHLSARPRAEGTVETWSSGEREGETEWDESTFVNEWLVRLAATDRFFLSYGRENLQWGPAFLFSPSNPFFLDNGRSNPYVEVPGMDFARVVWLPSEDWSLSFIANLDQGRQKFVLRDFDKTYAVKVDYSGMESYAGLVLSHTEGGESRVGAFGGWTLSDAFILYGDGVVVRNNAALYPSGDPTPLGRSLDTGDGGAADLDLVALVGGQYTLLSGPTFALEYLYNGVGYDDGQADAYYRLRDAAAEAFQSGGPLQGLGTQTLATTLEPRLRFLRRHYLMLQAQQNDIRDRLNLVGRWTQNLDDRSAQLLAIAELAVGDHAQLFSVGSLNLGDDDQEFGSLVKHQLMVGIEYTF